MSKKGSNAPRAAPVKSPSPFSPSPLPAVSPGNLTKKELEAPEIDLRETGPEHRQFPRARFVVPVSLWIGEGDDRRFSATLRSVNISVSGTFVESTFFLPLGTELEVSLALSAGSEPVRARAVVVRDERPSERTGQGRSGMGLRFVEFFGQTEVMLARLFLGQRLLAFAQSYLQSKRARSLGSELDRVVDALAAWELTKVTSPDDPWRGTAKDED